MDGSRDGKKRICKPKFMDCLSCPDNHGKDSFCNSTRKCTVPYAIVQGDEIEMWLDDVDLPDGWS